MDREDLAIQLYDTLTEIGTKRRSIQPWVLEDFPLLFKCPQVFERAISQTKPVLAEAANSALLEAIKAIPDQKDKLIAEGVLAVGRFEGKEVNERIREIDATPHIGSSTDGYKRRRPRVLRAIAQFLIRETVNSSLRRTQAADTGSRLVWVDMPALNTIARVSSELHYHALTALFVSEFDRQVQENAQDVYRQGRMEVWYSCSEALFPIYLDFVAVTRYCLREYKNEMLDSLSSIELADLEKLSRTCAACGPVALYDLTDNEYDWYMERLWGNALPQHGFDFEFKLPPGHEFYDHRKISFKSPLPKLYVTAWLPWYEANMTMSLELTYRPFALIADAVKGFADEAPASAIELIVAKTSAIYELIGSRFELESPFRAISRRQAEKDIAHHYIVDEWLPLFSGKSLKAHAEEFLSEKATELAKPEIVWFSNIS